MNCYFYLLYDTIQIKQSKKSSHLQTLNRQLIPNCDLKVTRGQTHFSILCRK